MYTITINALHAIPDPSIFSNSFDACSYYFYRLVVVVALGAVPTKALIRIRYGQQDRRKQHHPSRKQKRRTRLRSHIAHPIESSESFILSQYIYLCWISHHIRRLIDHFIYRWNLAVAVPPSGSLYWVAGSLVHLKRGTGLWQNRHPQILETVMTQNLSMPPFPGFWCCHPAVVLVFAIWTGMIFLTVSPHVETESHGRTVLLRLFLVVLTDMRLVLSHCSSGR
jgi:hypothetical protein